MNYSNYIREGLSLQNIPVYERDIAYIHWVLNTVNQAQLSLNKFPNLYQEVPITIFDKRLIR